MTPPLPPPLTLSKIWHLRVLSIYASKIARKSLYVAMLRHHVVSNITNTGSFLSHEYWRMGLNRSVMANKAVQYVLRL